MPGFDQIIRTLRLYRRFELEDLADLGSLEFPFILYERRGDDARGWVYPDASDLRIQAMAKTDTISWSMKPEEALHTIVKGADEWKMYRLDETDAKLEALPDYKTLIDGIRRAHRENLRWEKRAAKTS